MTESNNFKSMKIVNIHTGKQQWTNYIKWKSDYLDKHVSVNYKILTFPDLVDVFKINDKGSYIYIETTDRKFAIEKYIKIGNSSTIKNADMSRFDKKSCRELTNPFINPKNQSSKSLKTKYFIRIKPMVSAIKRLSPVWKFIISIIAMIIGGFLTYLIIEWYKTYSYV